jgi:hypothetical protein
VDYDARMLTLCPLAGCQEPLSVFSSGARDHIRFVREDGVWPTTMASLVPGGMVLVDTYGAVVLIDYYDCEEH